MGGTKILRLTQRLSSRIRDFCAPKGTSSPLGILIRGAGRPDLLLTHLCEVLLEPILRPLAVVGKFVKIHHT
jgi:hypothetical protein